MKLSVIPVSITLALAATASAQSVDKASAYEVLLTALPKSLLEIAVTNQAEVSSIISSQFAAGNTPAWFSSLPRDIQTYLVPVTKKAIVPAPTIKPMMMNTTANMTTRRTTHITTVTTGPSGPTTKVLTSTMGPPPTTKGPSPSKAGAPAGFPTGVVSVGLAGAVGLIGLLAL